MGMFFITKKVLCISKLRLIWVRGSILRWNSRDRWAEVWFRGILSSSPLFPQGIPPRQPHWKTHCFWCTTQRWAHPQEMLSHSTELSSNPRERSPPISSWLWGRAGRNTVSPCLHSKIRTGYRCTVSHPHRQNWHNRCRHFRSCNNSGCLFYWSPPTWQPRDGWTHPQIWPQFSIHSESLCPHFFPWNPEPARWLDSECRR